MNALIYRVTLQEPVIVTALEGEPNSAVSFDYLPGSALRGMIIGAYMRHNKLTTIDAASPEFHRLFLTNSTRFLNGYRVEPITHLRSLPAPATWSRPKAKDDPIEDSVFPPFTPRNEEARKQKKEEDRGKKEETKSVKGFWVIDGEYVREAKIRRVLNVHNDRNRKAGRALGPDRNAEANPNNNPNRGTIFRYDALAAGQTFEAAILCDHVEDVQVLAEVFNSIGHTLLGGAVSAGYGRVTLKIVDEPWEEAPRRSSDRLVVTLLSDVILRDSEGQYSTTCNTLCAALRPFLGDNKVLDGRAFLDVTMHGGFNRKWGLPLPQMPALKMGSVIELTTDSAHNESKLMELLWNGIGERRNEGFGRVAVNWQPFAPLLKAPEPPAKKLKPPDLADEVSQQLWERTKDRMNQTLVETEVLRITYNNRYRIEGPITRTQLMRLRAAIKDELRNPTNWKSINDFLSGVEGKDAGEKIAQTKIGGHDLRGWLQHPEFKEIGENVKASIKLMLMDAVLERAIKARAQGGQEETHG